VAAGYGRRVESPQRRRKTRPLERLPAPRPSPYHNIPEVIVHGEITVGVVAPVGCVAVASDEDCTDAMLVRRRGDSLLQLLTRLD
jgi:hypothetical protein